MPDRKVLSVLVVSFAAVISTWLIFGKSQNAVVEIKKQIPLSTYKYQEDNSNADAEWKKLLSNIGTENSSGVKVLSGDNSNSFDETSVTGQLARDFLSRYLEAKGGGQSLTSDDTNKIVQNILSSPQYLKTQYPLYKTSDLHVVAATDIVTVKNYRDTVNLMLKNRSSQIKDNPLTIAAKAARAQDSTLISRLDYIIEDDKNLIKDLLSVDVPKDAYPVHLAFINSCSALLSDLESMRQSVSDPMKGFVGEMSYTRDITIFQGSLDNLNAYFVKKLGSSQ